MTTGAKESAQAGVRAAWDEYLEATRGHPSYDEIEPHAWERLKDRLRSLGMKLNGEPRS